MLHLVHSISPPATSSSSSSINNQKLSDCFNNAHLLAFKKSRRNGAMEKDSEFEVDPDKAREALRKLDEQMQSLSKKQATVPKIKVTAEDLYQASPRMTEGTSVFSGSLTVVASALIFFTIFYNVIFMTVIKPSIDGDYEPISATSSTEGSQEETSVQKLLTSPNFPLGL
ncbi:hypothetical protein ACJIZ3_016996 [Penstemon smallii]|uniref:Transmembrane protein n=1 Tax=Penstemon smallii TaxID=265156 RepID=A0ABD3SUB5_9LAMI